MPTISGGRLTFLDDLGILVQGVPTVVASESATSEVPSGFSLVQNYPNPWDPSTIISYSLPQPGEVERNLYNALGQQLATLFSGFRQAGTYQIELSAEEFSSGTYFHRLQSPGGIETQHDTVEVIRFTPLLPLRVLPLRRNRVRPVPGFIPGPAYFMFGRRFPAISDLEHRDPESVAVHLDTCARSPQPDRAVTCKQEMLHDTDQH